MALSRRAFLRSSVLAAAPAPPAPQQDDWQGVARVVAVGDVHGDKDAFVAVLKMAGVVDDQERWAAGATHLVQIGDIVARGTQTRQVFDYLMRLESEAAAAGGKVHAVIGNHDAGAIYGDLRSILPEEYLGFRTPDSEARLAKALDAELAGLRKENQLPATPAELDDFKRRWLERHPPGFVEHREAFAPNGPYGSWIRAHNSVIRINDTLFLHAGISPKHAATPKRALNTAIRRELADPDRLIPGLTSSIEGPLWYRGLAELEEAPLRPHLAAVLRFHSVRRIVIGHCVTRSAILPRFDSRVVNIDIGLSRFFGRPPACLILEPTSARVLHRGSSIPLPGPGQLINYLKAVESADVTPSPVTALIEKLRG
ncbi:MAG: metallophosphoesterase [Acidobacteria bacterium]|nr:metallophosphoesterase [Acidobacteriota bacterium]